MALLSAVVLTSKSIKDGKNKVRIAVAHNGETRYIVSDIILESNKEFKNGVVVKRPDAAMLNTKIRKLLQHYQAALDEMEYINGMSCPELVYQLKHAGENDHPTLQSVYDEYIYQVNAKESTKYNYRGIWGMLNNAVNHKVRLENITVRTVLNADKTLRELKYKPSSIHVIMGFLRTLINYAIRCGYVRYKIDPYVNYRLPKMHVRESWLSVDEVKAIRDIVSDRPNVRKCRDIFMLSYYLGGANITDLIDMNFNELGETIKYVRKKNERHSSCKAICFKIPPEAMEIINRYKDKAGYLDIIPNQHKDKCRGFLRYNIKLIGDLTGIKNLIFYSARKSFAQHAFNLGINTAVIDYLLGHSSQKGGTCLYAYIYTTPELATNAIRKVLDNLL